MWAMMILTVILAAPASGPKLSVATRPPASLLEPIVPRGPVRFAPDGAFAASIPDWAARERGGVSAAEARVFDRYYFATPWPYGTWRTCGWGYFAGWTDGYWP